MFTLTQALRAHPEMARFIEWVQDKPSDFNPQQGAVEAKVSFNSSQRYLAQTRLQLI